MDDVKLTFMFADGKTWEGGPQLTPQVHLMGGFTPLNKCAFSAKNELGREVAWGWTRDKSEAELMELAVALMDLCYARGVNHERHD